MVFQGLENRLKECELPCFTIKGMGRREKAHGPPCRRSKLGRPASLRTPPRGGGRLNKFQFGNEWKSEGLPSFKLGKGRPSGAQPSYTLYQSLGATAFFSGSG
eukprot:GHVT01040022.1.p1 GENE.GHVT01040022.1~~GHVT01040022.1.p1  ORF type:complete len:103 (+),score=4.40 GHVT01040022.1:455-763(+)